MNIEWVDYNTLRIYTGTHPSGISYIEIRQIREGLIERKLNVYRKRGKTITLSREVYELEDYKIILEVLKEALQIISSKSSKKELIRSLALRIKILAEDLELLAGDDI